MDKETVNEIKELLIHLKNALQIYAKEEQEKIIEREEDEFYRELYPFDEYYCFKQYFIQEWI